MGEALITRPPVGGDKLKLLASTGVFNMYEIIGDGTFDREIDLGFKPSLCLLTTEASVSGLYEVNSFSNEAYATNWQNYIKLSSPISKETDVTDNQTVGDQINIIKSFQATAKNISTGLFNLYGQINEFNSNVPTDLMYTNAILSANDASYSYAFNDKYIMPSRSLQCSAFIGFAMTSLDSSYRKDIEIIWNIPVAYVNNTKVILNPTFNAKDVDLCYHNANSSVSGITSNDTKYNYSKVPIQDQPIVTNVLGTQYFLLAYL